MKNKNIINAALVLSLAVLLAACGGGGGDSAPAPDDDQTPPVPPSAYALTVYKTGVGTGTVSGSGINCGLDCSESIANGNAVTLTATPDTESAFGSWTGCDSVNGAACTVTMSNAKAVTVTFGVSSSPSITITGPASNSTSTTGTYTLTWTVSGLVSYPHLVQEAPDTSFSLNNRKVYTANTLSYAFSNKPDGRYCYRVVTSNAASAPICITVARPATATVLRIVNNTHYAMIDIRLNNTQKTSYPYGIPPGGSFDFVLSSSGTVNYNLGVGFYNSDGTRNVWFTYTGATSVTLGQVTTISMPNPTLGQLLSGFNTGGRNWDGLYYCYSCQTLVHSARFNFGYYGNWTFYDDLAQTGTGSVQLVSWPDYSPYVKFRLCSTCSEITLWHPFGTFYYNNGPADWSIIEYVAQ